MRFLRNGHQEGEHPFAFLWPLRLEGRKADCPKRWLRQVPQDSPGAGHFTRKTCFGDPVIYEYHCPECDLYISFDCLPFQPPKDPRCECGGNPSRVYNAQVNTAGCKDHDHIPEQKRVADPRGPATQASADRKEAAFRKHIESRRSALREAGNRGGFRHTHSVPADLYHGKIRETGDRNYWSDPANLRRHSSTRVG